MKRHIISTNLWTGLILLKTLLISDHFQAIMFFFKLVFNNLCAYGLFVNLCPTDKVKIAIKEFITFWQLKEINLSIACISTQDVNWTYLRCWKTSWTSERLMCVLFTPCVQRGGNGSLNFSSNYLISSNKRRTSNRRHTFGYV